MTTLLFPPSGGVRFIHSDEAASVARAVGPLEIRRASYVEPTYQKGVGDVWEADLDPVGGPILGPFLTRREALAAEHAWLVEHDVPVPVE